MAAGTTGTMATSDPKATPGLSKGTGKETIGSYGWSTCHPNLDPAGKVVAVGEVLAPPAYGASC